MRKSGKPSTVYSDNPKMGKPSPMISHPCECNGDDSESYHTPGKMKAEEKAEYGDDD